MSAREIDDHLLAPPALADAVRAVLNGRAVEIVDDLHGGETCTIVTARGERARDAIAVALPEWRAAGPWAVPAGATVFDRVPDIGLVGATTLATASVDLLRLAGADPIALRVPDDVEPAASVPMSVVLQAWCERTLTVEHVSQARLPTFAGDFMAHVVRDVCGSEHVLLARGDLENGPCHVVAECVVGMAMGGLGCGCRARLEAALQAVENTGAGMVLLVRADLFGLAAPGACPDWSTPDPAAPIRHRVLGDAARHCVIDHQLRSHTRVRSSHGHR